MPSKEAAIALNQAAAGLLVVGTGVLWVLSGSFLFSMKSWAWWLAVGAVALPIALSLAFDRLGPALGVSLVLLGWLALIRKRFAPATRTPAAVT